MLNSPKYLPNMARNKDFLAKYYFVSYLALILPQVFLGHIYSYALKCGDNDHDDYHDHGHDDPHDGHDVATEHQTGLLSHCPALRVSDGGPGTRSQMHSSECKILHFHCFRKYQIGRLLLSAKDYIFTVFV